MLLRLTILMMMFTLPAAHAAENVCGPEVKAEVAKMLSAVANAPEKEKLAIQAELYAQYKYCAGDNIGDSTKAQLAAKNAFSEAAQRCGARISKLGSVHFEEMSCCGYDPQRRQFACPVKIKQRFGFGAAPLAGSREYVLHCVKGSNGFVPVARDSVHLANEMLGNKPSWQFAVIANANENLQTIYPMNGETRVVRSILSWGFEPTACNFQPIWGNALTYRIRLDQ